MRGVRIWCIVFLVLVVLALAAIRGVGAAWATTGNSDSTPIPAHYQVPRRIAALYPGQYVLTSVASGARLSRGQMAIDLNAIGYLQGVASFYGYDTHGYQTSWVARLYNFRVTGPNRMSAELLDPLGTTVLGKMSWQRARQGDLTGSIALPKIPYGIHFHRNVKF